MKKIKPMWVFKSYKDYKIWKIFPTRHDKILCELRDLNKRVTSFVCLSIYNGNKIWEKSDFEEPWWIQIADVDDDIFFLCEFKRPDLPAQGKTYAVSSSSGEVLWKDDEFDFMFALDGRVYGVRNLIDSRFYFVVDARTGEILETYGDEKAEEINELRNEKIKSMEFIETSISFDEYHPDYETAKGLVDSFVNDGDPRFPPEVLVKENISLINYHIARGVKAGSERFKNVLKIVEINTGKLLYQDVLYDDLSFFIPDAFFCKDDFVFYVREQIELIAIKLPHQI
ncbi:protein of unknown function (DUF4905) [Candidatus Thermokryptus mobilis]|uniref:Uncharacterized protein n=1 Tax=Candidatus Thermokryptus mobilis TaxID=1643428 RepID=A0A0S4MTZ9_9BACT|nr:DUF4905 domain-containing protein [Candidatus Thermokryptus mobilis]CUU02442.1 protein of unknown function (DUF4905) [Candidatus Thermokryptus mobilis]